MERDVEFEQTKRITKSIFFKELETRGIDLDVVANGKRIKNEHFHNFNLAIIDLNEDRLIDITDMVLFLEEDMFEMKVVVSCLNEENLYLLREELSKRYNIKSRNKLDRFLAQGSFL